MGAGAGDEPAASLGGQTALADLDTDTRKVGSAEAGVDRPASRGRVSTPAFDKSSNSVKVIVDGN
jgi:hypothetical protein